MRTCIAPFVKLQLKALKYGSHRVTPANYTIPASTLRTFARWRHLNGRNLIQLATHLSTRKDERLSWPSWLTYSGRYTHISGHTYSATDRAEVKVRLSETDVLTTELHNQPGEPKSGASDLICE